MSECFIYGQESDVPCKCDNCEHECRSGELHMIRDIELRLDPGCPVPSGQCPECGALSYIVTDRFDEAWKLLAEHALCDSLGGMEHQRVKREWNDANKEPNIPRFIIERANAI